MNMMTTQSDTPSGVSVKQKPDSRRGGRPTLLPEERRRNQLTIGFTDAQFNLLIERAEAAGLSEIELIRRLSLNLEIKTIPAANREAIIELNRIGRNINQVARKLSTGVVSGLTQENINIWLSGISETIAKTGKKLVAHDGN